MRIAVFLVLILLFPAVLAIHDFQLFVVSPVDGSPVIGANVSLVNELTGVTYSGSTDSAGRFYALDLPEGRYSVRIGYSGAPISATIAHKLFMYTVVSGSLSVGYVSARNVIFVDTVPFGIVSIGPYATFADSTGRAMFVNIPRGRYLLRTSTASAFVSTPVFSVSYNSNLKKKRSVYPFVLLASSAFFIALFKMFGPWVLDRTWNENLFGPARDMNFWRYLFPHDFTSWGLWSAICLVFLFWLITNTTEYFKLGLIYSIFLGTSMAVPISGDVYPGKRNVWVGVIGTGPMSDYPRNISLGLGIGLGFVALQSMFLAIVVPSQLFSVSNFLIMNIILVGFIIPYVEEMSFNSVIVPVIAQRIGVVPAVLISAFSFGLFHWATFGGTVSLIIMVTLFRLVAATALVTRWSTLPGYVGHIVVNIAAVLSQA